jgi:hypothetical protein
VGNNFSEVPNKLHSHSFVAKFISTAHPRYPKRNINTFKTPMQIGSHFLQQLSHYDHKIA